MKKIIMIFMLLLFVCSLNYADEIENLKKILNENIGKEIVVQFKNSDKTSAGILTEVTESFIIFVNYPGYKEYVLISQIAGVSFREKKK